MKTPRHDPRRATVYTTLPALTVEWLMAEYPALYWQLRAVFKSNTAAWMVFDTHRAAMRPEPKEWR